MTIEPAGSPPPGQTQRVQIDRPRSANTATPARVVSVLLLACCVTSMASGLYSLRRAGVVSDIRDGATPSDATLDGVDGAVQLAAVTDFAVTAVTAIVFIVWFWRLISNGQLIERMRRDRSEGGLVPMTSPATGWSIGAWLIPLANFVLPAYFLARVDRVSDRQPGGRRARVTIVCWAVAFGLVNVLSRLVWRVDTDTLAGLEAADRRDLWLAMGYVVTAVLAILMVRLLTSRQRGALDAVGA